MALQMPDKKKMVVTNDTDPIDHCFHPLWGFVYRARLINTLRLLDASGKRPARLLEVGYGSGQLMPELSKRTDALVGLDAHPMTAAVRKMLEHEGVRNLEALHTGDVRAMSYPDGSFDAVVSVSTLEHIVEIEKAAAEIARVLKPGGAAVLSFPHRNVITDAFYKMVGHEPRHIHPSSHEDIMRACGKVLKLEKRLVLWPWLPVALQVYSSCLYRKP